MPIRKRWSDLDLNRIRQRVPTRTGVYELRSGDELVYIGRARNLQRELAEHATEERADSYRYEVVDFLGSTEKRHRKHFDRFVRQNDQFPAWNTARP